MKNSSEIKFRRGAVKFRRGAVKQKRCKATVV